MKLINSKATRFLLGSFLIAVLVCVSIFAFIAMHMSEVSTATINEVGALYMSGMSAQISNHFETAMQLQLEEVEALAEAVAGDDIHEDREKQKQLIAMAKALDFNYLGFYTEDNNFEMLYGAKLSVTDPVPFYTSLSEGEKKIAIGKDENGNDVILMGIPSTHAATEEHACLALVGALPADYIGETLSLEENAEHVYSYIIRRDGSFVVRGPDAERDNYFDRVLAVYGDVGGRSPEEFLAELRAAIEDDQEFSSEFTIYGERRHLYCTRLPYSEWYLITFMSYGTMDSIVNGLSRQWSAVALLSGGIILVAMLALFSIYFRFIRQQMESLDKARKEAENATRAKSEFLSNMSHDIRTPMNAIVGMTAIATANIDDKEQVQNCLKKITLSSKHLLGLINDVLDMSKIESGKMTLSLELVSLREVMDGIVSIVQPQVRTKNQQFNVFIHDIAAENVYCDSVRLNQVMLNLLSNAIKFTPDGGSISVSLYEEDSPKGEAHVRTHIVVQDTGIGMTPEFQKKIFDSFTREDSTRVHKTEGTGLGMAITKYIVDAMGGTIEVQSELEKGSQFHVILDLEKMDTPEAEMILPDWNMLVVDDDQQLCESATASLKSIGIHADWTLDGESAIEMTEKRYQERNAYHIILLDWKLPGIDGIETARRIRQRLGDDVPILLISAYDWSEIEHDAREAGINGFISKPLFRSTLYHSLKQFTGETPAAEEQADAQFASLAGMHVLLAEDNELNWEIAHDLLTAELGLQLDWAENGQICVDKFRQSPEGYYAAVLMDIRMPVMTGYQATEAIRATERSDRDIPIIAMTADAFAEDAKKCLDCGMNAHIAKPIDIKEVAKLLKKYVK